MINDKILIFAPYKYDINGGGPSGFIAHNLVNKPNDFFVLSHSISDSFMERLQRKIYSIISKEEYFSFYYRMLNAHRYKFVYFHDCLRLQHCLKWIPKNQIVILQSHCPELPSQEYQSAFPEKTEDINFFKKAEKNAFERADIVIFPNEGCVPLYKEVITPNNEIKFILSGAKQGYSKGNIPSENIIKNDKINLMYIGRRNEIKGFDIVLNTYRDVCQERKDLNLILVGEGKKIEEEGICDIGFSNNPIGWYNSVDYLINANRQSYFDLSIIEALSTGVPIIMSDNYGHKYYENKSPLIHTYDALNSNGLKKILLGDLQKRNFSQKDNQNFYLNNLTDEHYYNRFKEFALTLIN